MADDNMDLEALENGDAEAVQGGGGYVDDDIDLDDDDDDEPLVGAHNRSSGAPGTPGAAATSLKRRFSNGSSLPEVKKREKEAPHPDDYLLRAAGTGALRDYVVAKYVTRMPDLSVNPHMRLFRKTEATATGRERSLEAHRKQQIYYNRFSGKRRLERNEKLGIVSIPDRYRKGWTMEVMSQEVQLKRLRKAEQDKAAGVQRKKGMNGMPLEEGAGQDAKNGEVEEGVDVFEGTFDGKSTTRYAIMVLTEGSKTVDVVPVDEYAWFSFRTNRAQGVENTELTEKLMAKFARKGQGRISKMQNKYEEAQGIREQGMGDNSRIKQSKEFAGVGIRRSMVKREAEGEEEAGREQMDYEQEFDDDDLAQVDKETVDKTENRVLGDAEQNAKDFRKMIKDEPVTSTPASPGSESDDEAGRKSPREGSRSPSPSRPTSASRSPTRSTKSTPTVTHNSRQPTPLGTTPGGTTPFGISPSPSRSPRGNTPQRLDLSHLLPPPGTLPTVEHVSGVLTVLLKGKARISFKEGLMYFERKTKEQKANLTKILKQVALVTADPVGSKNFYISWKKPPTGAAKASR